MTEHEFQQHLMLALGARPGLRIWRQNTGSVPVRDARGHVRRVFSAGPPKGAADISGIVRPDGWRLEIECKDARGKRTEQQVRWAEFIAASGGVYVLVRAGDGADGGVDAAVAAVDAAIAARRARP